jgi:hypothetical protein
MGWWRGRLFWSRLLSEVQATEVAGYLRQVRRRGLMQQPGGSVRRMVSEVRHRGIAA